MIVDKLLHDIYITSIDFPVCSGDHRGISPVPFCLGSRRVGPHGIPRNMKHRCTWPSTAFITELAVVATCLHMESLVAHVADAFNLLKIIGTVPLLHSSPLLSSEVEHA